MAADYAGAKAAIIQRFLDNWVSGPNLLTPVGYVNSVDPTIVDEDGDPRTTPWNSTWVMIEVVNSGSRIEAFGSIGNNNVVYYGLIKGHVFVKTGDGTADADAKALAIGEIFRDALFYDNVTAGCFVRSGYRLDEQPRIDGGDASSGDGNWFAVTATIPFEFWTRK